jgi:hypothetical protein
MKVPLARHDSTCRRSSLIEKGHWTEMQHRQKRSVVPWQDEEGITISVTVHWIGD